MVNCKGCKKSEVGKDGRVCYIKAIHYQDIHVKDEYSCKYGVEKPVEANKGTSQPITPPVQEKTAVEPKTENKQEVKTNNTINTKSSEDSLKDANKSNVSATVK